MLKLSQRMSLKTRGAAALRKHGNENTKHWALTIGDRAPFPWAKAHKKNSARAVRCHKRGAA